MKLSFVAIAVSLAVASAGPKPKFFNFAKSMSKYVPEREYLANHKKGKTYTHVITDPGTNGYFKFQSNVEDKCLAIAPAMHGNRKLFKKHFLQTGKGLKKGTAAWKAFNSFRKSIDHCKQEQMCFNPCYTWHMVHYWQCEKSHPDLVNLSLKGQDPSTKKYKKALEKYEKKPEKELFPVIHSQKFCYKTTKLQKDKRGRMRLKKTKKCAHSGSSSFFGHYEKCQRTLKDFWTVFQAKEKALTKLVDQCTCLQQGIKTTSPGLGMPAFCWVDKNKDKVISPIELQKWLDHVGQRPVATFMKGRWSFFDKAPQDNALNLKEFMAAAPFFSKNVGDLFKKMGQEGPGNKYCKPDVIDRIWDKESETYRSFVKDGEVRTEEGSSSFAGQRRRTLLGSSGSS